MCTYMYGNIWHIEAYLAFRFCSLATTRSPLTTPTPLNITTTTIKARGMPPCVVEIRGSHIGHIQSLGIFIHILNITTTTIKARGMSPYVVEIYLCELTVEHANEYEADIQMSGNIYMRVKKV